MRITEYFTFFLTEKHFFISKRCSEHWFFILIISQKKYKQAIAKSGSTKNQKLSCFCKNAFVNSFEYMWNSANFSKLKLKWEFGRPEKVHIYSDKFMKQFWRKVTLPFFLFDNFFLYFVNNFSKLFIYTLNILVYFKWLIFCKFLFHWKMFEILKIFYF